MELVETPEFSIEVHPMFQTRRVFAGSIGLRQEPQTTFSPQMSVWTSKAEKRVSPQKRLDAMLKDDGPLVERRAIAFAGMSGEMSTVKDRLEDFETNETRDWYRLRALMVSPDGATWYHATAMTSADDLAVITADFERLLGSISIKLAGEAAQQSQDAADQQTTAQLEKLKKTIDAAAETHRKQEEEREEVQKFARPKAHSADIEARFNQVLAAVGLEDKRGTLREIVMPTLSLTENNVAPSGKTGLSRIGGGPDLAQGMDWPRDESGFYLNFLAQINLADLPERAEALPETGLLSFFTGTDYTDWYIHYSPSDARLIAHNIPDDAAETTETAFRMVVWDSDLKRFVADKTDLGGISVETDEKGVMTFKRDGRNVMVFASEYEFSRSAQALRFEPSLSAPFGLPGPDNPKEYAQAGIDDPSDCALAITESFKVGDGPQHQMFGITGVRELSAIQKLASQYASKQGWSDIEAPDDWFILIKLASGGAADFSFSDYGDYIFMVNRKDAAKGDFSRVFAFVESG